MAKLAAAALVALSVSKLETALKADEYTAEELAEALELEQAKDDVRVTAVEAIEAAIEDLAPSAEPEATGPCVAKGKAITSKVGILGSGTPVKPAMFAQGQTTIDALIKSGHLTA